MVRIRKLVTFLVFAVLLSNIRAQDPFDLGYRLTSDESFREAFLASYGVNPANEPSISEVESIVLEKVAEMLQVNTAYAQTLLEAMLTEDAEVSATFNYLLANLYFENEEYVLAENEYTAAIEKLPSFQRVWRNLGVLKMRGDSTEDAMKAFSKSVSLGDTSSGTYGRLGFCHYELGNYLSSESAYSMAILNDPENIQWLEGKAEVFMASNRYEDAVLLLDELIGRNPTAALYWIAQSNAYLALEQNERAAANIEVVQALGQTGRAELLQLARLYSSLGLGKKAVDTFRLAVDRGYILPTRELVEAALSLHDQSDINHASQILDLADLTDTEQLAQTGELYYRLRASLAESESRTDDAIENWEKALESSPLSGVYLLRLANLYLEQDQPEQAQVYAERATQDSERAFYAHLFLSKLFVEQQRYDDALRSLRQALQIRSSESLQNLYTRIADAAATMSE